MFNSDNWQHVCFVNDELKVIISYGAEIIDEELVELFYPTLVNEEGHSLFQQNYRRLEEAVSFTNKNYGHWEFGDLEAVPEGDGCSSCQAH